MSDMKCPFCQQELKYDAWNEVYMCRNPNCKHLLGFGTKELWQELINERQHATDCQDLFIAAMAQKIDVETELDRTRKVLDAALDKLKRIQKIYTNAPFNVPINYANVCTDMYDVATEQIKELDNE